MWCCRATGSEPSRWRHQRAQRDLAQEHLSGKGVTPTRPTLKGGEMLGGQGDVHEIFRSWRSVIVTLIPIFTNQVPTNSCNLRIFCWCASSTIDYRVLWSWYNVDRVFRGKWIGLVPTNVTAIILVVTKIPSWVGWLASHRPCIGQIPSWSVFEQKLLRFSMCFQWLYVIYVWWRISMVTFQCSTFKIKLTIEE